ncbi:hypothetical protein HOE04_03620 [archaeon]|jgi:hypothetical protein|nr:hypothetical protein [archaeon]
MTGKFRYEEMKNAPEALRELGIKPVFVPRQDGYREHYAFLGIESDSEVYSCGDLMQLVGEGERRISESLRN